MSKQRKQRTPSPSVPSAASCSKSAPVSPFEILLSYQNRWVYDDARFKYGLWSRQTGKDFSCSGEEVRDVAAAEMAGGKTDWLIAAPSERQSLEHMVKVKEWAEASSLAIANDVIAREGSSGEALLRSQIITFPGGSRIIAVPGLPDTVRGFSANVVLTEFAFFEDPDKTWRAILPSITNPLRGGPKKVRLVTTPNGIGNKAHELWAANFGIPGSKWSCHHVDIHEAVAGGLPVDIEELRTALNDPEGWAQEYELQFLDAATVLLPYELIAPCENPQATETIDPQFWGMESRLQAAPLFGGLDFGRKKDLTVLWTLELVGGTFRQTREVLCLEKMSTPEQVEILRPRLQRMRRCCLDYTGPGTGLGDYLVKEFGEYDPAKHKFGKIELCTFTNQLKTGILPKLRMAFEARTLGIPVSRVIREDLHSISRVALAGGGITYRAPHTADGHADRCTALALAIRAAAAGGDGQYSSALI